MRTDHLLFGAAYYLEYLPYDRLETDMEMMERAGMNTIRIAESTWSTCEPQPGVFDFTYVDRALDAAQRAGIDVIVGTPTYAVPSWLVKLDPSVLAVTPNGQGKYGARQIMDVVNATYRFYGERVIRKLISHVADHPAVIGYQVDNETKYYDSVSEDMQRLFVKYLREKFHGDLDELNHHFGLDYWSNRIDSWEDFPDVTATINESLGGEFDKFRRDQVRAFLQWQADIVREYAHDDQFITHNFDFEWRGYSYGVQPAVDHFKASTAVDITGVDIYHPTEDDLTKETVAACFGDELAFDEAEWDKITSYFARTGRETTPNNRKQAMVPTKGHKIINNHGTAPGAWFEQDGHCAVLMPGVPHEMKAMWTESVRPLLMERQNCTLHSVTLRVLGGESDLEYRVRHLLENANPTAAIYCKTGECEIRITARARSDEDGEKMCRAYAKKFYDMLGDAVYDEDVAGLEETVVHTLQEKGLTIATAESCTGGLIAQRLTSVSGSSEVFGYGFVTYWEQAKAKLVGVDPAVIEKYNVVSAPVAAQMALGAAKASGADIAVSVTGVAGPTGGDEVRPVGTVYLGAARDGVAYVKKLFVSRPDRALVRARAAQAALELALRLAQGKVPAGTQALTAAQQSDDEALAALDEAFVR